MEAHAAMAGADRPWLTSGLGHVPGNVQRGRDCVGVSRAEERREKGGRCFPLGCDDKIRSGQASAASRPLEAGLPGLLLAGCWLSYRALCLGNVS